jgi:GNAT superfamily N-acetyltransferase
MEFRLLGPGESCATPELKARCDGDQFPQPDRRGYCVLDRDIEVAFAAFDLFDPTGLVLYEVYVLPEYRGRGTGTKVLDFAKALAAERGDRRLLVRPFSFSDPPEDAEGFYRKNGFRWAEDFSAGLVMEFLIAS